MGKRVKRIGIAGLGMMGRAIAEGLLEAGYPRRELRATTRTAPSARQLSAELGIAVGTDNLALAAESDILLLALKPPKTLEVTGALGQAGILRPGTLVVSIAAGVTTSRLQAALGERVPVIRAMPNTPCAVGCGATVLAAGRRASTRHLQLARTLFEPLGAVLELEEKHLDTVTGLSASGPAFVYVILEALADGGVARGLPRKVALELAARMVYGAAAMVLTTGRHPASLKDDVTTPAGCTIAGILALEDGGIRSILSRAVEIASKRAGELANSG